MKNWFKVLLIAFLVSSCIEDPVREEIKRTNEMIEETIRQAETNRYGRPDSKDSVQSYTFKKEQRMPEISKDLSKAYNSDK